MSVLYVLQSRKAVRNKKRTRREKNTAIHDFAAAISRSWFAKLVRSRNVWRYVGGAVGALL